MVKISFKFCPKFLVLYASIYGNCKYPKEQNITYIFIGSVFYNHFVQDTEHVFVLFEQLPHIVDYLEIHN